MEVLTERLERLLALSLLQQLEGRPKRDKIQVLNRAGFSNVEIADLLETTAQVVSQSLYETRRHGKASPRKVKRTVRKD